MATEIAQAQSEEAQTILMEAYESSKIRGKKLGAVRRLLDRRFRSKQSVKDKGLGRHSYTKRPTADDLLRVYQREAYKQRLLARKADFTQARLLSIVQRMKDIMPAGGSPTPVREE